MSGPAQDPIPQRLAAIREQRALLEPSFDAVALRARLSELEERMGAPGFWDDQAQAAGVSAEHARASRRLETWTALESDAEDLEGLAELAAEDPSMAAELDAQIASVEGRLAELEEARLFSGEYDGGDALVS